MADWPSPPVGKIRAYGSAHYAPQSATNTFVDFDTEDPLVAKSGVTHTTSGTTNLTGTVQKTASSAAVVGTGTAFTTELKVGDQITIPGTASETRVVKTITDATHLTVDANFANSASGQTATRKDNTRFTIVTPGLWLISASVWFQSSTTGLRYLAAAVNGADNRLAPVVQAPPPSGAFASGYGFSAPLPLAAGDYVSLLAYHENTGLLGLTAGTKNTWLALVRLCD